jgi:ferredoxin
MAVALTLLLQVVALVDDDMCIGCGRCYMTWYVHMYSQCSLILMIARG